MSGNGNAEEGGEEAGGFPFPSFNIASVAGVAFLGWQMYQTNKKMKEMELEIKRSRVYIDSQADSASSLISQYKNSTEEKMKVFKTDLSNTLAFCRLSKLDELEELLVERQHLFCSFFKQKSMREELEKKIRKQASTPLLKEFNIGAGLDKIFMEDQSCDSSLKHLVTGDKRRNGSIMWDQLRAWRSAAKKNLQKPS